MPRSTTDPTRLPARSLRVCARRALLILAVVSVPLGATVPLQAQSEAGADQTAEAPVETRGLASGPYASMEMLYERTILRVNVLHLTLRFDPDTAQRLERLAAGNRYHAALAETVVDTALEATDVLVRTRFLRAVSLGQYLDGIRGNLADARVAGYLTPEEETAIGAGIGEEYEPLRDRGIRAGDTVWYRVRGDRLDVVLEAANGDQPLEITVEGPEHRRAVLGGYLAPGSDFREPLVRSLFSPAAD